MPQTFFEKSARIGRFAAGAILFMTVGADVEGAYDAFVPRDVLKPYLSDEGIAVFGGSRPVETSQSEK